jgi:serine/threonine protein kinase
MLKTVIAAHLPAESVIMATPPELGHDDPPPLQDLPPGTLLGPWRVERTLARGGFGIVYRARDAAGRAVALKEYLPAALARRGTGGAPPQVAARDHAAWWIGRRQFFDEARVLARVRHPGIVAAVDFLAAGAGHVLALELLPGPTLQELIAQAQAQARVAPPRTARLLRESTVRSLADEVLRALAALHRHGVIHGDLKPAHAMLAADGRVVLIDLGTVRRIVEPAVGGRGGRGLRGEHGDRVNRPMHTPGYAAPELLRAAPVVGPATDLYALGATLHACMTGAPPPPAETRQQHDTLAADLDRLAHGYSPGLRAVVVQCLALDPARRPHSAGALRRRLARADRRR